MTLLATASLWLVIGLAGCSNDGVQEPAEPVASWEFDRRTAEDVTSVRNLSGSKWGGDATLTEIVTIGVLEGESELMLAQPSATWLTDEEIYIADRQDHHVRVYDLGGNFLRQIGRGGEGPGELEVPRSLAITDDGRLLVGSVGGGGKVSVFATQGRHLEDWSLGSLFPSELYVVGGDVYTGTALRSHPGYAFGYDAAFQRIGPDGPDGEMIPVPALGKGGWVDAEIGGRSMSLPVPLAPMGSVWTLAPTGHLVIGYPDAYRFEVRTLNGKVVTVIERFWEPVPIAEPEREEQRRYLVDTARRFDPEFDWDGADIPLQRPAYEELRVDRSGRVWVRRTGASLAGDDCDPTAERGPGPPRFCWMADTLVDIFDLDGAYLGRVVGPDGHGVWPDHVHGDLVSQITQDDDDTPQVKVYRLGLPEGAGGGLEAE